MTDVDIVNQLAREIGIKIEPTKRIMFFYQAKGESGYYQTNDAGKVMSLQLFSRRIPFLPKQITQLSSLEHLTLLYLQLEELPADINNLTNLKWLNVGFNRLNALPDSISLLTKLTDLYLLNNLFESIPLQAFQIPLLQNLSLENNKIQAIEQLPPLPRLLSQVFLSDNKITHIPLQCINDQLPIRWHHSRKAGMFFFGNPLVSPPSYIVKRGHDTVKAFLQNMNEGKTYTAWHTPLLMVKGKMNALKKLFGGGK